MQKIPKRRGKRVFLPSFLDPGSPGPSGDFSLKELARLGKPVTSGVSLGSLGRAAMVPNAFFDINRHEWELGKGCQHSIVKEIGRIRKEEERKRNEVEALPNRNCDQPLHRSLFGVLRATIG